MAPFADPQTAVAVADTFVVLPNPRTCAKKFCSAFVYFTVTLPSPVTSHPTIAVMPPSDAERPETFFVAFASATVSGTAVSEILAQACAAASAAASAAFTMARRLKKRLPASIVSIATAMIAMSEIAKITATAPRSPSDLEPAPVRTGITRIGTFRTASGSC